jgi:hypothetical protein
MTAAALRAAPSLAGSAAAASERSQPLLKPM